MERSMPRHYLVQPCALFLVLALLWSGEMRALEVLGVKLLSVRSEFIVNSAILRATSDVQVRRVKTWASSYSSDVNTAADRLCPEKVGSAGSPVPKVFFDQINPAQ